MNEMTLTSFSEDDIRRTQPALKIGLLATVTPEGLPHVTMLSTLMACGAGAAVVRPVHRGQIEAAPADATHAPAS